MHKMMFLLVLLTLVFSSVTPRSGSSRPIPLLALSYLSLLSRSVLLLAVILKLGWLSLTKHTLMTQKQKPATEYSVTIAPWFKRITPQIPTILWNSINSLIIHLQSSLVCSILFRSPRTETPG